MEKTFINIPLSTTAGSWRGVRGEVFGMKGVRRGLG